MIQRRIVSICLPHFAIQRWRRRRSAPPDWVEAEPVVMAREGRHGSVVHDMNAVAAGLGIGRGVRVTEIKSLVPELRVEDAALERDSQDLAALSAWSRHWCPWTRADGSDGLLLDTTGSDHLWGGEAALLSEMRRAFAASGLTARLAVAPTIGAARAFARHGRETRWICAPEDLARALAPLSVAALRLDAATVLLLERLGLRTIGALATVPRLSLARRFRQTTCWADPLLRLDQAMGHVAEPLVAGAVETPVRVLRQMAEPVTEVGGVAQVLELLMPDLCGMMEKRGVGARRLRLTGYRVDCGTSVVEAALSRASRDAAHLAKLVEPRLDTLECGFGFETITLEAPQIEPLCEAQSTLGGRTETGQDIAGLIDRLTARLGPDAVLRLVPQRSHLPERAERLVPASRSAPSAEPWPERAYVPLRLLRPPQEVEVMHAVPDGPPARMLWRRRTHVIAKWEGPERIAPEWWREASTARLRDYYRIEDSEGRRYWIFREGLAGDGRGGPPRWFIHGLDA